MMLYNKDRGLKSLEWSCSTAGLCFYSGSLSSMLYDLDFIVIALPSHLAPSQVVNDSIYLLIALLNYIILALIFY